MKKRIIFMLFLLAMILSFIPLGTVAYAREATDVAETETDPATSTEPEGPAESTEKPSYYGRVGNYTFYSDDTLRKVFGFTSKENLWEFLEEVHEACSDVYGIKTATEENVEKAKMYYVEWENTITESGEYKYPIKYDAAEVGKNGVRTDQDDRNSALEYIGGHNPLFSEDMGGFDVFTDNNHIIQSIRFYCDAGYTAESRKAIRQTFVDATEPVITLFKGMRDRKLLTDEQIILLVCDYYASCSLYDMGRSGGLDAYGTIIRRKSVCQGQATAISYILENVGIPCKIAANYKMNHAFNVVTINGKEYNLCITSSGTKRQGKIAHEYLLISTRDYIVKRLGGKPEIAAAGKSIDYVFGKYMDAMNGGPAIRTEEQLWIDTATDTTYENAFWTDVDSAFVLCGRDLIFISRDGKLCRWKGGPEQALEVISLKEGHDHPEGLPRDVLVGRWSQDGNERFHTLITDYEVNYDYKQSPEKFEEYNGKYYFSSNDTIYELTFHSEDDGRLTYSYEVFFDAKEMEILRDGECIYDFYVHQDEILFKIGTRYDTMERDGRYAHYYIGNEKVVEVPVSHEMVIEDRIKHIFTVEKAAVESFVKDENSIVLEFKAPYNNPQSRSSAVQEYTRIMGEYIGEAEKTVDGNYYRFVVTQPNDAYPGYAEELAKKYASSPITINLRMTDSDGQVTRTQFAEYNSSNLYELKIEGMDISFDKAGKAAVNYKVPAAQLKDFTYTYIRCEIPFCEESGKVRSKIVNVKGEKVTGENEDSDYYCYSLQDFAMGKLDGEIKATLFAVKDTGAEYHCTEVDTYVINEEQNEITETITIGHSLSLNNDLSINYRILIGRLEGFANSFIRCEIPSYAGNEEVCSKFVNLEPLKDDKYYVYSLQDLAATQMGYDIKATLFVVTEEGEVYRYGKVDTYSILTYASKILGRTEEPGSLEKVCAELLRYGAMAQRYKGHQIDALVDRNLTKAQRTVLTPLENVAFANNKAEIGVSDTTKVKWVGRGLSLENKIAVRFIFDAPGYEDETIGKLSLHVTYVGADGKEKHEVVTRCSPYGEVEKRYAFDFNKLLSTEWRKVLHATIYEGDTPISSTFTYSVDTYRNEKDAPLMELCQAMLSFSDSAKAYFAK